MRTRMGEVRVNVGVRVKVKKKRESGDEGKKG